MIEAVDAVAGSAVVALFLPRLLVDGGETKTINTASLTCWLMALQSPEVNPCCMTFAASAQFERATTMKMATYTSDAPPGHVECRRGWRRSRSPRSAALHLREVERMYSERLISYCSVVR